MSELANTETDQDAIDVDTTSTDNAWTPPTKEEWDDLLARKSRADSEAASRKRWLRDLGYDPKTGEKVTDADVSDSDATDKEETVKDSAKPVQVDTAAIEKAATEKAETVFISLAEAGVGPKSLARVSKLIDRNEDIAPQIDALKEEFPELFKRPRTANVVDAASAGAGAKPVSTANQTKDYRQILAERALKM